MPFLYHFNEPARGTGTRPRRRRQAVVSSSPGDGDARGLRSSQHILKWNTIPLEITKLKGPVAFLKAVLNLASALPTPTPALGSPDTRQVNCLWHAEVDSGGRKTATAESTSGAGQKQLPSRRFKNMLRRLSRVGAGPACVQQLYTGLLGYFCLMQSYGEVSTGKF